MPVRSLANIVRRKQNLGHCRYSWSVRQKERTETEKIWVWKIWEIQGSEQQRQEVHEKGKRKPDKECSVVRLKKIRGRTTVRGHTNRWKTWPLWNRGKRLLSKIVQENASQKNDRYWTDGQNTALSCTIKRPMEIHQYWTAPRLTHTGRPPILRKVEASVQVS